MRNKIIIGALLIVGFASIAYAAFSQMLVINGTANTSADWDVRITGISLDAVNSAGATGSTTSFTTTSATFDVDLDYPGAQAVYTVTVENQGTIPAVLDSITDLTTINSAAPTDITFAVSGVTEGTTTIAPSGTNTITVTATWNPASTITATQTKTANINFNYIQDTP